MKLYTERKEVRLWCLQPQFMRSFFTLLIHPARRISSLAKPQSKAVITASPLPSTPSQTPQSKMVNKTYNEIACGELSSITNLDPPTNLDILVMRNSKNFSTALESHYSSTATFGFPPTYPSGCFVYCSITAPATVDSVEYCVNNKPKDYLQHTSYGYCNSKNNEKTTNQVRWD